MKWRRSGVMSSKYITQLELKNKELERDLAVERAHSDKLMMLNAQIKESSNELAQRIDELLQEGNKRKNTSSELINSNFTINSISENKVSIQGNFERIRAIDITF
jgi:hypothetical protein